MQTVLDTAGVTEFLDEVFPLAAKQMEIEAVAPMRARLRLKVGAEHLRPGGTVSGPSMFMLADCAFYVAVLGMIGREALTVTTTMTINFLRKPAASDMICDARILKLGRTLATGDATLWSVGDDRPVAHAVTSYAIPPRG